MSRNCDSVQLLKFLRGNHPDGIPGESGTDPGADLAADTLIKPDLYGGDWDFIFLSGHGFDTVHGTKGDTSLAPCAVVFIDHSHESRSLFLFPGLHRELRYSFIEIVFSFRFCSQRQLQGS